MKEQLFNKLWKTLPSEESGSVLERRPVTWHPIGGDNNNINVIANQQASAIAAILNFINLGNDCAKSYISQLIVSKILAIA